LRQPHALDECWAGALLSSPSRAGWGSAKAAPLPPLTRGTVLRAGCAHPGRRPHLSTRAARRLRNFPLESHPEARMQPAQSAQTPTRHAPARWLSRELKIWLLGLALLLLAACTAGPNPLVGHVRGGEPPAGFWLGLWHGVIAPITLVISLFNDRVNVYEVFNNGHRYDFGFGVGVLIALSGSGGGAAARA